MKFNEENLVIIETLNEVEASVFIKFLKSEIIRHYRDVEEALALIRKVREKFNINSQ